jgi:hypothetical protein
MNYLFARLSEPSTWRGLIALATAFGVALAPEQIEAVIAGGLALIGIIGAFFPDKVQP